MPRITIEEQLRRAYADGYEVGYKSGKQSMLNSTSEAARAQVAIQLMQEASKMMSRAGYLLDKVKTR